MKTLDGFDRQFPTEDSCKEYLVKLRWPNGVTCPRCGSRASERVSEFGSTPCKAHYRCSACQEPFDYFKCF